MAQKLKVYRGNTFIINYSQVDVNGLPVTSTTAKVHFTVKSTPYDTDITDSAALFYGDATGFPCTIAVAPNMTLDPPGSAFCDITIDYGTGNVNTVFNGTITVLPTTTNRASTALVETPPNGVDTTYNIASGPNNTVNISSVVGATGPQGPQGIAGTNGTNGQGVPAGGVSGQVLTKLSGADYSTSWQTPSSGTGGSSGVSQTIAQTSHGFVVGNLLRLSGTSYVKAQADSAADGEVVGIVSSVINSNSFVITAEGYITSLTGLVAGSVYFLSAATAGTMSLTQVTTTGQVDKPVFVADTTTSGFFHNYRGLLVGTSGGGGGGGSSTVNVQVKTTNYTLTSSDEVIIETTAGTTLTLHDATSATSKRYVLANKATGNISFATTASQTVDNATAGTIIPDQTLEIVTDGINWRII